MVLKEDAEYFKSKHIIESNDPNSSHMDSLAIKYAVPKEHISRYEQEEAVIISNESENRLEIAFNLIKEAIGYYVDISEDKKTILALWVIGTYFHNEFETFPYIFLNAMRGCAKTRTVRLLTKLAKDGEMLMSLTESALFRTKGTLGIDEFESLAGKEKQALREVLNASYKKGVKIVRMKKKKGLEGEEIVPEYFEPYRPIILANIWGIEEVVGDRCITMVLEKSDNKSYTMLVEDFNENPKIEHILLLLKDNVCSLCSLCSLGTSGKQVNYTNWNLFIKNYSTHIYTTTLTTLTTLTTHTEISAEEEEFFKKIVGAEIYGRDLELYFPLFIIANEINDHILYEILEIAKINIKNKRMDDVIESKDVTVYDLVSKRKLGEYYRIKEMTNSMTFLLNENEEKSDWLNPLWMGRALKRLNLIVDRRRIGQGIEVTLNIEKAKEKMKMFK